MCVCVFAFPRLKTAVYVAKRQSRSGLTARNLPHLGILMAVAQVRKVPRTGNQSLQSRASTVIEARGGRRLQFLFGKHVLQLFRFEANATRQFALKGEAVARQVLECSACCAQNRR